MRVKVLGSAAGGGFPQWNCACSNCRRLRDGALHGKPRTQTQVAVSLDRESWYLLGASPDLRQQIEATPELHPRKSARHTPIAAVILTNADVDHVLGLLTLREFQPLRIYAAESVRRILTEDNSIFAVLQKEARQITWHDIRPGEAFALQPGTPSAASAGNVPSADGSGLRVTPIAIPASYPRYVTEDRLATCADDEALLALAIEPASSAPQASPRLLYVPALPRLDAALREEIDRCDLLLLDGTFWTDDELIRLRGAGRTAREIGHLPLFGPGGILDSLADLRGPRKIFIHVNNTNPILDEDSPEFRRITSLGWEVAADGASYDL